ncbi:hypothetical protein BH10ACT9_BH10ACT9_41700 [soil metagenome]
MSGPYPPPFQGASGADDTDPRLRQSSYQPSPGQAWGRYRPLEPPNAAFPPAPPQPPYPPGPLPPAVPYPRRGRWKPIVALLLSVAVIAAVVAVVFIGRDDGDRGGAVLTSASVRESIQGYLDALSDGDVEAISRNALCGLYDGVRDRRADDALARLSSDAFQKQFSSAQVTSVDTMVFASPSSAQVLFSMQVVPTMGGRGADDVRQGVAQVLAYGDDVLVCSYVLRTAGTF